MSNTPPDPTDRLEVAPGVHVSVVYRLGPDGTIAVSVDGRPAGTIKTPRDQWARLDDEARKLARIALAASGHPRVRPGMEPLAPGTVPEPLPAEPPGPAPGGEPSAP